MWLTGREALIRGFPIHLYEMLWHRGSTDFRLSSRALNPQKACKSAFYIRLNSSHATMSKYFPPLQFPSRLSTLFADHLHNISKKIVKLDHFIVIICCVEILYQERRRNICGVLELKYSTSHFINSSCNRLVLSADTDAFNAPLR